MGLSEKKLTHNRGADDRWIMSQNERLSLSIAPPQQLNGTSIKENGHGMWLVRGP